MKNMLWLDIKHVMRKYRILDVNDRRKKDNDLVVDGI